MRLSPKISLYIARYFMLAFISTLFAIIGITLLFDSIELLRRLSNKADVGLDIVLIMAFLKMPQMLTTVLPFSVMIASMIVFWRLTRSHELVVIRSVGVSAWEFLAPVLVLVFTIGVFNLTVVNPLSASMYQKYERMEDDLRLRSDNPLTFSSGGLWMRESLPNGGQAVIHAKHVLQDSGNLTMSDISVLTQNSKGKFLSRFQAEQGDINDGILSLWDVWVMKGGKKSRHEDQIQQPTSLSLEKIQDKFSSPESLSFWELPGFIKFFESAGFTAHKHVLHWHALLASPLLLCAMVLVAAIFSLNPNIRKGGLLFRVVGGIGSAFVFYFFTRITYALGLSNSLPLFLAAWSPVVVTLLLSLTIVFHQEDG